MVTHGSAMTRRRATSTRTHTQGPTHTALALLALVVSHSLVGCASAMQGAGTHGHPHMQAGSDPAADGRLGSGHHHHHAHVDLPLDSIDDDLLPGGRKLRESILAGPLPGLTFIPGFPGMGGRKPGLLGERDLGLLKRLGAMGPGGLAGGLGGGGKGGLLGGLGSGGLGSAAGGGTSAAAAAGAFGLASYVVTGTDPVAIALRQLSIVAIEAYGTAVQNSIKRGIKAIDVELARLAGYLDRQVEALAVAGEAGATGISGVTGQYQLAYVQRQVRKLVIVRAALKDYSARQVAYVKFLTAATSAWTAWFYGIQYRFQNLVINIDFQNDPFSVEINRVLYALGDVTTLVGLLLQPFIKAFTFKQAYFNTLYGIVFADLADKRDRFTVTPVATLERPFGSGENLNLIIEQVINFANKLGTGENAQAVLEAATSARAQVAQALGLKQGTSSAGSAAGGFGDGDKLAKLLELLRKQQQSGK